MRVAPVLACCSLAIGAAGCAPGRATGPHTSATGPQGNAARRRSGAAADTGAALRRVLLAGQPLYCAGRRGHLVALTFDDGPGPYTHLALRELRRAGARATFFLVGRSVVRFPQWPRRELRIGAVGDHTATHADLGRLDAAGVRREIAGGALAIAEAHGGRAKMFRPPYEVHPAAVDREAAREGLVEVLWDVDSGDSDTAPARDYRAIYRAVRAAIRPGSIVLMHENRGQTIRALRLLLPWMHRHGLRSVSVPELLAADPPSAAQLRGGAAACERRRG